MISHARLLSLLRYDPVTGRFSRHPGGEIAGGVRPDGYRQVSVDGIRYLEHRLAWFFTFTEWPPHSVDHVDGDRANNNISNLRLATQSQNAANARRSRGNTSGLKGVTWDKLAGRWVAHIMVNRRSKKLGRFDSAEAAHAAYLAAALELRGDFARGE